MSTRLVILGLLNERPLYGDEIKQNIEEYMGDGRSIAFGSITFALDKLAEESYVDKNGIFFMDAPRRVRAFFLLAILNCIFYINYFAIVLFLKFR